MLAKVADQLAAASARSRYIGAAADHVARRLLPSVSADAVVAPQGCVLGGCICRFPIRTYMLECGWGVTCTSAYCDPRDQNAV